jgi:hypothetical protein
MSNRHTISGCRVLIGPASTVIQAPCLWTTRRFYAPPINRGGKRNPQSHPAILEAPDEDTDYLRSGRTAPTRSRTALLPHPKAPKMLDRLSAEGCPYRPLVAFR